MQNEVGQLGTVAFIIAGFFALSATFVTFLSTLLHLKNYKRPDLQRSIIRIFMMIPIYSLTSWLSLAFVSLSKYLEVIRDVYEAFVIYVFFSLLVNLLDGERALITSLAKVPPTPHAFPVNIFLEPIKIGDPNNFLMIKRGIVQFIIVKPVLAVFILFLKFCGWYHEGYIAWDSSFLWIAIFYNISVTLAMYFLIIFYLGTRTILKAHGTTLKFICVKAVVFFSFWQGIIISVAVYFDVIRGNQKYTADNIASAIQDFSMCIETFLISIVHFFAFSHKDYSELNSGRFPLLTAVKDFVGFQDILQDSLHTFKGQIYETSEERRARRHGGDSEYLLNKSRKISILDFLKNIFSLFIPGSLSPIFSLTINSDADSETSFLMSASARYPSITPNRPKYTNVDDLCTVSFPDINPNDDIEKLYNESRRLRYGDYNFPVLESKKVLMNKNNPLRRA
ncbi:Organic solute transporter Ost-alpha domain-containing protein [Rozella allomycis CSF55]|uniref:Organic solute transporter Ost-alpha domain-containing protein n=1 Tax=Rozella allomycis (strain CSF55) TaxID=988480 RepID=A0A075B037_ROZAC|nr:Organic solute transporter Ost-alpha domain-containing protein [Rozella allomycis CSF55]|eukprot:EPZ35735.1 Organic solute transporter Ost-alpha domain-containing protein [Rozella allomycis CSF55]